MFRVLVQKMFYPCCSGQSLNTWRRWMDGLTFIQNFCGRKCPSACLFPLLFMEELRNVAEKLVPIECKFEFTSSTIFLSLHCHSLYCDSHLVLSHDLSFYHCYCVLAEHPIHLSLPSLSTRWMEQTHCLVNLH